MTLMNSLRRKVHRVAVLQRASPPASPPASRGAAGRSVVNLQATATQTTRRWTVGGGETSKITNQRHSVPVSAYYHRRRKLQVSGVIGCPCGGDATRLPATTRTTKRVEKRDLFVPANRGPNNGPAHNACSGPTPRPLP